MGQILSSLYSALFPNKEYKLVMVGAQPDPSLQQHWPCRMHGCDVAPASVCLGCEYLKPQSTFIAGCWPAPAVRAAFACRLHSMPS